MRKLNRIAGAAAVFVVALMAASVPLKSVSADNDDWKHHRHWNGDQDHGGYGGIYFYSSPGYYYAPAPAYYYTPAPTYYYPPPPAYYPPPQPYYGGPSFGLSVRFK
jgi:hypothetical protein